ncbi:MAG: hypothetical protein D6812_06265 [Deltaproteobacteria bacterium]|nr:MAG: hypothetical protein D6812_06265 [Deltaproteobacteria bacterium]
MASNLHDKVIENNEEVRKIIALYIRLFDNYQEAAEKIGVSRDTIARYTAHRSNISLASFDRIVKVVQKHYTEAEILQWLDGITIEEIRKQAKRKNGVQMDHVMYVITPAIRALLREYTACFPNKATAARKLEINPRTFKAYLDGQIKSFPRNAFWKVVVHLTNSGFTTEQFFSRFGATAWEDLLIEKERCVILQSNKKELIEELIGLFRKGTIRQKEIDRSIRNAAKRIFGNLGEAMRMTMAQLEKRQIKEIRSYLSVKDFEKAMEKLAELDRYIALYRENEKAIWRASPKEKRRDWQEDVERYIHRRNLMEKEIKEQIERKHQALCAQIERFTGTEATPDPAMLRSYSLDNSYDKGDIIEHPAYGMGKVLRLIGARKMVVQFEKKYGRKILLMNNRSPRPEFWSVGVENAHL